jgi:hypothetical protein
MGVANQLYAGSFNDFDDSMAQEIEAAFSELLVQKGKAPLDTQGQDDRRTLFIAIARGVVRHLQKKQASFVIQVPAGNQAVTLTPAIGVQEQ